jgi:SAM-dependent methyltransferase
MRVKMDKYNSWNDYWNKENPEFDEVMGLTTEVFYENFRKKYPHTSADVLLDYGCGPGVLIQLLKDDCKKIIGIDASSIYVEKCKHLFQNESNVSVLQITGFHDLIELLSSEDINQVITLSVIQYFRSLDQLTEYLDIFRLSAQKKRRVVRVLIADIIPLRHRMLMDFIEILFDAVKRKYLFRYLKFIAKYLKETVISRRERKLQVDYPFFEQYASSYNLTICKINGLTNHKNRYSVEILFTP